MNESLNDKLLRLNQATGRGFKFETHGPYVSLVDAMKLVHVRAGKRTFVEAIEFFEIWLDAALIAYKVGNERMWKCHKCNYTVGNVTYDDVVTAGQPICSCGDDMEIIGIHSDCQMCGGSGFLFPEPQDDDAELPDGHRLVDCCNVCNKYPDALQAAIAFGGGFEPAAIKDEGTIKWAAIEPGDNRNDHR